jgi:AcrR family transcriptional regulator
MTGTGRDRADELRTADGRVPGRRGRATRQRLLDTLAEMLVDTPYRDLTVVELARVAEVSPATFYQYFADVDAAIIVLADDMAEVGNRRLRELVAGGSWAGEEAAAHSQAVAAGFFAVWTDYEPLLRVVDLKSAEGDQRFRSRRTTFLNGPTVALVAALEAERGAGRLAPGVDPIATAAVLVAMLAHVAAHRRGLEAWGVDPGDLRRSVARQLQAAFTA